MRLRPPVIVGFDGSAESVAAVRFAAAEAARRECPLGIVHVRDDVTAYGESFTRLATAIGIAQSFLDEMHIVTADPIGAVAAELVRESVDAEILVVGRARADRLVDALGSVSQAVVTHARCPVVVVFGADGTDDSPTDARVVVAGVKHLDAAEAILSPAFAAAQAQGGGLEVVHCPRFGADSVREVERSTERLREQVELVAVKYPDVEVSIALPRSTPVDALSIAAETAALLVVGAPRFGPIRGTLLASTAQALLGERVCPVMFVPRASGRTDPPGGAG